MHVELVSKFYCVHWITSRKDAFFKQLNEHQEYEQAMCSEKMPKLKNCSYKMNNVLVLYYYYRLDFQKTFDKESSPPKTYIQTKMS